MYQMFRNQFLSFSMYQSKCCHGSWHRSWPREPSVPAWFCDTWRPGCSCSQLCSPGFSLGLFPPPWCWDGLCAQCCPGARADGSHALLAGFVQFLQYYYQSGCLYRLRALGERHNMDLTVGKPDLPLPIVPVQLDLLLPQGPWLLATSLPAPGCCSANWELWFLLKVMATVIFVSRLV